MPKTLAILLLLTLAVLLCNAKEEQAFGESRSGYDLHGRSVRDTQDETSDQTTSEHNDSELSVSLPHLQGSNETAPTRNITSASDDLNFERETTGAPSTESLESSGDFNIDETYGSASENASASSLTDDSSSIEPISSSSSEDSALTVTDSKMGTEPLITDTSDFDATYVIGIDELKTDLPSVNTTSDNFGNYGSTDALDELFGNLSGEELDAAMGNFLDVMLDTGNQKDKQGTTDSSPDDPLAATSSAKLEEEATESSSSASVQPSSNYSLLVYNHQQNVPCILASMTIKLNVQYTNVYDENATTLIKVPERVGVTGSCGQKESNMTLTWIAQESTTDRQNSITFQIVKDDKSFYVSHVQVAVFLDENEFPHTADMVQAGNPTTDLRLFSAPVKDGIHVCHSQTEVDCGKIRVLIEDVSLIAYNDRLDVSNRKEKHCSVKISLATIVGGVVGALIVICIVASLIWYRKKSESYRSELP